MKAAVLESHKEQAIGDIEQKLDKLMKAKGITFDEVTPPVRNPNYRTLQTLQRIDAKLFAIMKIAGLAEEPETAVIVEPAPDVEETQEAQADGEKEPGENDVAQATEPEAAQPVVKPDRKNKTK